MLSISLSFTLFNSRRITYGIGYVWGMPSLSPLYSLGCHTCWLSYSTLVCLCCGRTNGRSVGVLSRDYQIFSDGYIYLVKSFFEIHKTGIDLFRVIMNPLNVVSIKVRSVKTWSAVRSFSKKPICDLWSMFEETTCSRSRWFVKTEQCIFPGCWGHRCPGNLLAHLVRPIYKIYKMFSLFHATHASALRDWDFEG